MSTAMPVRLHPGQQVAPAAARPRRAAGCRRAPRRASSSASARSSTARACSIAVCRGVAGALEPGVETGVEAVEAQLAVVAAALLELALEVAQRSGRPGRRSAGRGAPGRPPARCRTAGPSSGQPWAASASIGPLASCSTLGRSGSASQAASAASSSGVSVGGVDEAAVPSSVARASAVHLAGAGAPGALHGARRRARWRAAASQADTSPGASTRALELEADCRRRPPRRSGSRRAGRAAPGTPGRRRACAPPGGPRAAAPGRRGASSRSRSRTRALSRRLRITSPRCSRSASPFLPVISSAWVMTLSRPSYVLIHLAAKPWPTPGTPGRLSEVSPTIAASSG